MKSKRDMLRSGWTRVLSKAQIIKDFSCEKGVGKISLMKILKVREPLIKPCEGLDVILADAGYYWLQLALDKSHVWFTVMFDPHGNFIQIYADVTDGNDALAEDPVFDDMYLDYVVMGSNVYELDRDELEDAYSSGAVSEEQYMTALAEGEKICSYLTDNTEQIKSFFIKQFEMLRPELDGEV